MPNDIDFSSSGSNQRFPFKENLNSKVSLFKEKCCSKEWSKQSGCGGTRVNDLNMEKADLALLLPQTWAT